MKFNRLHRDTKATTALEMALVAPVFFMLALGMIEVCYDFFLQQALDYAVSQSTRQIQTGRAQKNSGDATAFVSSVMQPYLSGLLSADSIVLQVSSVNDYRDMPSQFPPAQVVKNSKSGGNTAFGYCNAAPKQLMFVQAAYMAPVWFSPMTSRTITYNGATVLPIVSTAAFMTENFPQDPGQTSSCNSPGYQS